MKRKSELNFKELRKLPQKAIRAVQGTFDEIGLHPKQDFLEMVAKTPSAILGFFCGIGNVIKRQYEKDMEKTLKRAHSIYSCKVQSAKYLLQEELFELFQKYISAENYHLLVKRKEHIQIVSSQIYTKGTGKDIQYIGGVYCIRIRTNLKSSERFSYSKQMELYSDLKNAYMQKRDADGFFFGNNIGHFRPILSAGFQFSKPPYLHRSKTCIHIKVLVFINNIDWQKIQ